MSWVDDNNKLTKLFSFKDFKEALNFVNKVGELAESNQHHPDILIFDYNQVKISLTTHDEGYQITDKDHNLAQRIDEI